jgi:hypothetical protein
MQVADVAVGAAADAGDACRSSYRWAVAAGVADVVDGEAEAGEVGASAGDSAVEVDSAVSGAAAGSVVVARAGVGDHGDYDT